MVDPVVSTTHDVPPDHARFAADRAQRAEDRHQRQQILDVLYRMPDPFDTLEDYQRARHADLSGMTPVELDAEARRVRIRLTISTPEDGTAWLTERLAAIAASRR